MVIVTKSKKAVLVVGPPRSGTSVVANVISELGVHFGDPAKFVDPEQQKHNPVFFELSSLNEINDEIFQHFSKKWADFDWIPDRPDFSEVVCSKFEPTIVNFIENEFSNSESIGLKDPRFCYTLPLWETILTKLGFNLIYILVRRLSSSVYLSNQIVNRHSSSTNFRLVAQSNILASRFVQNRPFIPIFYEELLREPVASIREICKTADLPFDRIENASSVLDRKLQHHNNPEEPLFKYFSNVIDSKETDPEEYDRYREIYLTATHEKNEAIEKLNLELAEKEQGMRDFPYWRETMKVLTFLRGIMTILVPPNSRRRSFANFVIRSPIKLYKRANERKYHNWLNEFDAFSEQERSIVSKQIKSLEIKPLLSVLMPVYNPPIRYLDEAIKSVQEQLYPHWELCIADDASPNHIVRSVIEKYAQEDLRIRYIFRNTNGHISAASNSALELVTGEFVVLLDHDDLLHPLALYHVAKEINKYPDVEVIYSDEDKLNEQGKRAIPYFKPDYDYDLLLSHNMVSHLGAYRTTTIRKAGGFRIGFEGSQDYDLLLRVIEKIEPRQIRHIPHVLYHWRVSDQSTASGLDAKPYAYEAGLRVIKDHLLRKGIKAFVEPAPGIFAYRVTYSAPKPHPSVSIIISSTGLMENLEHCVDSILSNTTYQNYSISIYLRSNLAVETQTRYNRWSQDTRISVLQHGVEINQSKLVNQLAMNSKAEYLCLLDGNTNAFSANWLELLVGQAVQPGVGAVSPLLLQPNGRIVSSGFILRPDDIAVYPFANLPKYPSYHGWATIQKGYSAIPDSCQLVSTSHFLDIGGYNEIISTRYYANIDFCLRLREKGLRNVVTPAVELYIHKDTAYNQALRRKMNFSSLDPGKDQEYIKDRWQAWLKHDPAFNPNLDLKRGRISLATSRRLIHDWE